MFDSFYSAELGYWFYLRLDQGKWEAIQNREMMAMVDRIESLVTNAYVDPTTSQSSRLAALAKAWSLLSVSPYAGFVDSVLLGESGSLLDLIESEIKRIVDSLSITYSGPVVIEEGRPVEIGLAIASSDSVPAGRYLVTLDDSDNHQFATVVTDRNGAYRGSIDARYDPGKVIIAIRVDLAGLGIDADRIPLAIQEPLETVQFDVRQIRAGLRLLVDEGIHIGDAESGISALMSDIAPFKIGTPSETDRFLVSVDIQSRTAPTTELTEGITICFLTLSVTISSGGDDLFAFKSNERKGAGLDLAQAQARAFDELIDDADEFYELRLAFDQLVDRE